MTRPRPPTNIVKPKTIEDQIRLQYYTPSPVAYRPRGVHINDPKPLGKISEARVPSVHDHEPRNKSWVPGPGSYQPLSMMNCLPEGGRINRTAPAEKFKLDEYPTPAPGDYGVPNDPMVPRQVNGKFSKDPRCTKFIKDEEMRSRHIPGPGAHQVQESMDSVKPFCPSGGRTLHLNKPASYFDVAPKRWEANPPPASYDLPSAVKPNKAQGKLVYKYESATITETKAMMARLGSDQPGPGAYDLPETAPLGGAPTLKGRAVAHGMPHPYAYNCAPDLCRNYESLAPVRQQNSAVQIYGNGLARRGGSASAPKFTGAAAGRGRGGGGGSSRPSSSGSGAGPVIPRENLRDPDKAYDSDFPQGLTALDLNPEDVVQWRSGGFAPIKKTKSSPNLVSRQQPDHPIVEDAKKYYPSLGVRNRDRKTFLPGTVRKNEPVATHENAEEYQELRRRQVEFKAVAHGIQNATAAAMEPLDLGRLRKDAMEMIVDKAKNRLLLEGVSEDQHDMVVAEMLDVLNRQVDGPPPAAADAGEASSSSLLPPQEA
eukprot:TRINITY_DN442_c0_g2_i1.p1 TRINITY_DN442_c0_g2~~TRINITY_DN442_c0_g2_i1.p1  ORF type:complete len:541 (-),score=98.10 TRINITY_DN442_c0_g2_i1:127-1749(-)